MPSPEAMTQAGRPDLSVVVLCFRAGERARLVADNIASTLVARGITKYQLVLVGNYLEGTSDVTPEVVRGIAANDPHVVCSAVAKRGMMGWDMRTGLDLARGERLAIIDGDGQILAEDLLRTIQELDRGGYDLVKASRVHRGDGLLRKVISLGFNALFRLLFPGLHARDVNAKPKVMTRAAFQRLELAADDWFIDAEIMIQARRLGFRIGEVETDFLALTGRRSFINLRTVLQFLRNLARYRLREFRRQPRA
ncbi:MAG TPA: glycosyltransferase family 2 protein [Thermoanaerobaculia bacterium]|nr:glycosyltransferase family 2 protein [Thermoanaerobaculia bacterium]